MQCSAVMLFFLVLVPAAVQSQESGTLHINPPGLVKPNGYTHVVVAPDRRTVYIAGQVAFDSIGAMVGAGDFRAQAEQVYGNLERALRSVGATFGDVVKTTTYLTDTRNVAVLREVRTRFLDPARPPANTLIAVQALASPQFLLEIEAVVALRAPFTR